MLLLIQTSYRHQFVEHSQRIHRQQALHWCSCLVYIPLVCFSVPVPLIMPSSRKVTPVMPVLARKGRPLLWKWNKTLWNLLKSVKRPRTLAAHWPQAVQLWPPLYDEVHSRACENMWKMTCPHPDTLFFPMWWWHSFSGQMLSFQVLWISRFRKALADTAAE